MDDSAIVPFDQLSSSDLVVDAVFKGGQPPQPLSSDPVHHLLPVKLMGGFRVRLVDDRSRIALAALCTSGFDPDWPDGFDRTTGVFTYYGDNKKPGRQLHDVPGNKLLYDVFAKIHGRNPNRQFVPPFFVFENTGTGRDVRFLGLAVPGHPALPQALDLVAVWRTGKSARFQNYVASFTVLDVPKVERSWIAELRQGNPLGSSCPEAFRTWVEGGQYKALLAEKTSLPISPKEQLPEDKAGFALVRQIWEHYKDRPTDFELCAAKLWEMQAGGNPTWELTRPTRDGGRDALGHYWLGPARDRIGLKFALEAKCFDPDGGAVGVKEVARLISRLRHREFGILVTTGHVGEQAYQEIRDDQHPVVVIAAVDVVAILRAHGLNSSAALGSWLSKLDAEGPRR